jgi:hypothetical protein
MSPRSPPTTGISKPGPLPSAARRNPYQQEEVELHE